MVNPRFLWKTEKVGVIPPKFCPSDYPRFFWTTEILGVTPTFSIVALFLFGDFKSYANKIILPVSLLFYMRTCAQNHNVLKCLRRIKIESSWHQIFTFLKKFSSKCYENSFTHFEAITLLSLKSKNARGYFYSCRPGRCPNG